MRQERQRGIQKVRCNAALAQSVARGMTLVELLVILALLVIIAALFMPGLHKALRSARLTSCGSNQQQMFAGLAAYADSYRGFLPGNVGYWDGLSMASFFNVDGRIPPVGHVYVGMGVAYATGFIADKLVFLDPDWVNNAPSGFDAYCISKNGKVDFNRLGEPGGVPNNWTTLTYSFYGGNGRGLATRVENLRRLSDTPSGGNGIPLTTALLCCHTGAVSTPQTGAHKATTGQDLNTLHEDGHVSAIRRLDIQLALWAAQGTIIGSHGAAGTFWRWVMQMDRK